MQRKCQRDGQSLICQLPDLRNQPTGGNRHIPLTDMQSAFLRQKMDKADQVIVIVQRFTRSHHNHVGNAFACIALNLINLVQHLRRAQVPFQAVQGRSTETAAHPTPHLRGNTNGISMLITHQDTLDDIAVREAEQVLSGSIDLRNLHPYLFQ